MVEQDARHNRPMEIDVRAFDGEARTFFEAGELAFSERLRDEDAAAYESIFESDRAIAAYDGDRVVGTAGIFSFDLTIPGGIVPAAGVTFVGVHPTHRRQGILRRMDQRSRQRRVGPSPRARLPLRGILPAQCELSRSSREALDGGAGACWSGSPGAEGRSMAEAPML